MKQAILITAFKSFKQLEDMINCFDENFELYIHIDKKSEISKDILFDIKNKNNVKILSQKFEVNWGGRNHLKCILYLSKLALENPSVSYIHLISGSDFPIKKVDYFSTFFAGKKMSYMNWFTLPFAGWPDENGGRDRLDYYCPYDMFDYKVKRGRQIIKKIMKIQKLVGFKRSLNSNFPELYVGSTWWSLHRECLNYVVTFTENNKDVFRRFKHTFCSEEFYFQTVLMNSELKSTIVNDNLRYIDWSQRNGSNPSILDSSDFPSILKSNALFARKMDYPLSEKLVVDIKESFNLGVSK